MKSFSARCFRSGSKNIWWNLEKMGKRGNRQTAVFRVSCIVFDKGRAMTETENGRMHQNTKMVKFGVKNEDFTFSCDDI